MCCVFVYSITEILNTECYQLSPKSTNPWPSYLQQFQIFLLLLLLKIITIRFVQILRPMSNDSRDMKFMINENATTIQVITIIYRTHDFHKTTVKKRRKLLDNLLNSKIIIGLRSCDYSTEVQLKTRHLKSKTKRLITRIHSTRPAYNTYF